MPNKYSLDRYIKSGFAQSASVAEGEEEDWREKASFVDVPADSFLPLPSYFTISETAPVSFKFVRSTGPPISIQESIEAFVSWVVSQNRRHNEKEANESWVTALRTAGVSVLEDIYSWEDKEWESSPLNLVGKKMLKNNIGPYMERIRQMKAYNKVRPFF